MPARRKSEWVSLSEARGLCATFGSYFSILVDELLVNAISSGQVPVRGVPPLKMLPVAIDGRSFDEVTSFDIDQNRLHLKPRWSPYSHPDFTSVEVEWEALNEFAHDTYPVQEVSLTPARVKEIDRAIETVYDDADEAGAKARNINELVPKVKARLELTGHSAGKRRIQERGQAFKNRRRASGKTVRSEQHD
jgi:hypothetical protein